jgi:DUF4097 and DUF4098 domain-containing protein YvlB
MKRPIVIVLLTIALVFVLAGIGAVMYFAAHPILTGITFDDGPRITASAEESQTLEVDGPVLLKVVDDAGDVSITGADVDEVSISITKTGFGRNQVQAEELLESIDYKIEQKDNSITLTFDYPRANTNIIQQVDFVVMVPFETTVDIKSSFGEINVSDIQGDVVLDNEFGNISVDKADGALEIRTNSGQVDVTSVQAGSQNVEIYSGFGTISLEQVSGADITIESKSGKLELENVRATKEMNLHTDFGNLDFMTGSAARLEARTNSGSIKLTAVTVSGSLTLRDDFGDVTLDRVRAASYEVESNSGSITIDGVRGPVMAHTGFGNIDILNAEDVALDLDTNSGSIEFSGSLGEGPHTVHSDFGDIELNIPADSALTIDIETKFGRITSDIPITVTLTGEITQGQQSGTINGGGAEIKVDTNSGDISIKILK